MAVNAVVHDFAERLEYSTTLSDEPSWCEFYLRLWPDLLTAVRVDKNSQWQKWGVDRMLLLTNGKQILVDEKKRERSQKTGRLYDDFLCEEISVWIADRSPRNKVGWTLDNSKRCDWIAYAIPELGKCYMLPFELLRLTCTKNLENWKRGNFPRKAPNDGYVTVNWAVPWRTLFDAMRVEMERQYGSNSIRLPTAIEALDQLSFAWCTPTNGNDCG